MASGDLSLKTLSVMFTAVIALVSRDLWEWLQDVSR
jgi:hypothetical protein